jgi:hypothetical protein
MKTRREGYWDYMGRKLREERNSKGIMTLEDLYRKDISEMQQNIHYLQIRVKDLTSTISNLNKKVEVLGGDSRQLEMEI